MLTKAKPPGRGDKTRPPKSGRRHWKSNARHGRLLPGRLGMGHRDGATFKFRQICVDGACCKRDADGREDSATD